MGEGVAVSGHLQLPPPTDNMATEIIPGGQVLTRPQVLGESWTMREFVEQTNSTWRTIQWMAKRRLIANTSPCPPCQVLRHVHADNTRGDGYIWRCPNPQCRSKQSLRHGSFYADSNLPLQQLLTFSYGWARDWPLKDCAQESSPRGMAAPTMTYWGWCHRDLCEAWLLANNNVLGGMTIDGQGQPVPKTVEIDESYFLRRKYNRGQQRGQGQWVFGGIERETGRTFMFEVARRDRQTLIPLIVANIQPGTIIMSDGWAAYANIDQIPGMAYTHRVVVHEHYFVDPVNRRIHTQNVENMWMRVKRKLKRQYGTSPALFSTYLHEFQWRCAHKVFDPFSSILCSQADAFPL